MKIKAKKPAWPVVFLLWHCTAAFPQTTCTITVNPAQIINPASQKLLGISFDGRSSMDYNAGAPVDPAGYFDPATGAVLSAVEPLWSRVPVKGTRYPGNLEILNWNWSYTIGPFAGRIAQPMGPNGSNPQALQFGFDEFMNAMTAGKGLPADQVQIMVNLYASVGQPNPAILAADWVEYCNAPNDGSNPRGGTDWAMLRDSFGHPKPYGVKIWNIGNEPWQPGELGNTAAGANAYIALAIPIIDSMLAVDPTLQITVTSLGNASSPWNSTLLASTSLMSRIWGFSSHAFYDEDAGTPNPPVSQVGVWISDLAAAAAAQGKKVISGDQAHHAPNSDPDKAVRWEGALATGNLLIMLSQISNVELSNFWIYGNVKATWHPIRQNGNGTYTFMAAAQLYEQFDSVFYDQSLATTVANAAGGGPVANARTTAFKSADGTKASVVVVNTDLNADLHVIPPSLAGFHLHQVKLMTAPSVNEDTSNTTVVTPLGNGNYALPRASILMFKFNPQTPLAVELTDFTAKQTPDGILLQWAVQTSENTKEHVVERSEDGLAFHSIGSLTDKGSHAAYRFVDTDFPLGILYYRLRMTDWDGSISYSKAVSVSPDWSPEAIVSFNPASGVLHLAWGGRLPAKATLFDAIGRRMKQVLLVEQESRVDVSGLSGGAYFLQIETPQGVRGGRVVLR